MEVTKFTLILLGSKKISVIACGQTSSMALSDAGEVRVNKRTRKRFLLNLCQHSTKLDDVTLADCIKFTEWTGKEEL